MHVVVVEDTEDVRTMLAHALAYEGCLVTPIATAAAATTFDGWGEADGLLTDWMMPTTEDGARIVSAALTANPRLRVVILTADANLDAYRGATVLHKPASTAAIMAALGGTP